MDFKEKEARRNHGKPGKEGQTRLKTGKIIFEN